MIFPASCALGVAPAAGNINLPPGRFLVMARKCNWTVRYEYQGDTFATVVTAADAREAILEFRRNAGRGVKNPVVLSDQAELPLAMEAQAA